MVPVCYSLFCEGDRPVCGVALSEKKEQEGTRGVLHLNNA